MIVIASVAVFDCQFFFLFLIPIWFWRRKCWIRTFYSPTIIYSPIEICGKTINQLWLTLERFSRNQLRMEDLNDQFDSWLCTRTESSNNFFVPVIESPIVAPNFFPRTHLIAILCVCLINIVYWLIWDIYYEIYNESSVGM